MYVCICIHEHVYMYVWSTLVVSHWVSLVNACFFVVHYYNDQDGWTALMVAADNGHVDIVTYLVEQGANKDLQNKVSTHLLRMIMIMIEYMLLS